MVGFSVGELIRSLRIGGAKSYGKYGGASDMTKHKWDFADKRAASASRSITRLALRSEVTKCKSEVG